MPDLSDDPALADLRTVLGHKVCGPCVLYREVASGGMGTVYRARHLSLLHEVAVKCMHGHLASILPKARERFFREARLGASLNHPNLVTVHDVGEHKSLVYLVMEWVEGEDLHERMKRLSPNGRPAPRPAPEVRAVGDALAQALEAVHTVRHGDGHGLLHRDVKPKNLLLNSRGKFKLADLGLARPLGDSEVSIPGQVFGTPGFMPPEQAAGLSDLTPAVDVYAFGMTLFYLCTATLGDDTSGAPVFFEGTDIPDDLAIVIDRCTARDPLDRYQNGVELLRAWREVTGSEPRWQREDLPPTRNPADDPTRPDDATVLSIAEFVDLPDLEDSAVKAAFAVRTPASGSGSHAASAAPAVAEEVPATVPVRGRSRLGVVTLLALSAVVTFAVLQRAPWAQRDPEPERDDSVARRSDDRDAETGGVGEGPTGGTEPEANEVQVEPSSDDESTDDVDRVSGPDTERPETELPEIGDPGSDHTANAVPLGPAPQLETLEVRNAVFETGPDFQGDQCTGRLVFDGPDLQEAGFELFVDGNAAVQAVHAEFGDRRVEAEPIDGGGFRLRVPFAIGSPSIEVDLVATGSDDRSSLWRSRFELVDRFSVAPFRYRTEAVAAPGGDLRRVVYSLPPELLVDLGFGSEAAAQILFVRVREDLMVAEAELSIAAFESFLRDDGAYRAHVGRFADDAAAVADWRAETEERVANFARGAPDFGVDPESWRYAPLRSFRIEEALGFADWLTSRLRSEDDRLEVAIPTPAEWEAIVRRSIDERPDYPAGSLEASPFLPGDSANIRIDEDDETDLELTRDSRRRQGIFGLFHLIGNMKELCLDRSQFPIPSDRTWRGRVCGGSRLDLLVDGRTPRAEDLQKGVGRVLTPSIGVRLVLRRPDR